MMHFFLMILSLFYSTPILSTVLATSNLITTPTNITFPTPVYSKVYDRATGIFYVGLVSNEATVSPAAVTINKASRPVANNTPTFVDIGADNNTIEFLSLAASFGLPAIALPYVDMATTVDPDTGLETPAPLTATLLSILNPVGTVNNVSTPLLDASGATGVNGQVTSGIVGLASSVSFAFVAVSPTDMEAFGTINSGIAVVAISNPLTLALTQVPAAPGDAGIKAQRLDPTTPAVNLPSSSPNNPILFPSGQARVDLYWDNRLQRLYVPLLEQVSTVTGTGARSVVVGQVLDNFGHLAINAIAPDAAFAAGATNEIVGLLKAADDDTQPYLSVNKVRTLHASTGPTYLIVNGDIGAQNTIGNLFYAIPLVDVGNPNNPIQGTEAAKESALVNGTFVTPAAVPADMTLNTDTAALIGAGPLPFDPTQIVTDLVIVGDTVYVSMGTDTTSNSDTGILYSQALFDQTGKVIAWTPWTRRAFPIAGFITTQSVQGPVSFFNVDAVTGIVWAIDQQTKQVVRTTAWNKPAQYTTLPAYPDPNDTPIPVTNTFLGTILNTTFQKKNVTSVLDLDQSTAGFTAGTNAQPYRYALFGGPGTVAFAVTSQAVNNTLDSPQLVTLNYTQPGYYLTTTLPTQCTVNVLEYARQTPGVAQNYFFAGTQDGLYVFDNGIGGGFDANSLGLLTSSPFVGHGWTKISATTIPGAIIDIKTTGLALYVLAYTTTPANPIQTTLYRIPFQSTTSTMFSPSNVITIAQSSTGVFASILYFSSLQIIMTSSTSEQIVLGTNQGLYRSALAGGVQAAISQANANWQPTGNNTLYHNGIAAVDNASRTGSLPTVVWPFAFQTPNIANIFSRSIWEQLAGTTDTGPYNLVPLFFNASNSTLFPTLPLTTYFWTDGGRRFAIVNAFQQAHPRRGTNGGVVGHIPSCPELDLFVLPYNTTEWAITNLVDQLVSASAVEAEPQFYWIKDIGSTGIILVGTNNGVIALD